MNRASMESTDKDFYAYTQGEISPDELYHRWKEKHQVGLFRYFCLETIADFRAIWGAILGIFTSRSNQSSRHP